MSSELSRFKQFEPYLNLAISSALLYTIVSLSSKLDQLNALGGVDKSAISDMTSRSSEDRLFRRGDIMPPSQVTENVDNYSQVEIRMKKQPKLNELWVVKHNDDLVLGRILALQDVVFFDDEKQVKYEVLGRAVVSLETGAQAGEVVMIELLSEADVFLTEAELREKTNSSSFLSLHQQ